MLSRTNKQTNTFLKNLPPYAKSIPVIPPTPPGGLGVIRKHKWACADNSVSAWGYGAQ